MSHHLQWDFSHVAWWHSGFAWIEQSLQQNNKNKKKKNNNNNNFQTLRTASFVSRSKIFYFLLLRGIFKTIKYFCNNKEIRACKVSINQRNFIPVRAVHMKMYIECKKYWHCHICIWIGSHGTFLITRYWEKVSQKTLILAFIGNYYIQYLHYKV